MTPSYHANRARVAELLTEAAEIEHDVLCQYLFAGFTMKKTVDEGGVTHLQLEMMRVWQGTLMTIARQEMEHLGIVNNLLTAIGESPYMWRAPYPLSSRHYPVHFVSALEPFGLASLLRFIRIEMPEPTADALPVLRKYDVPAPAGDDFNTIAALYREIAVLFQALARDGNPFVGPPSAQLTLQTMVPMSGFLRGISLPPSARVYGIEILPVSDLPSALAAITQIVDEGEGGGDGVSAEASHFGRFVAMYAALRDEMVRDPAFQPGRPVVRNPKSAPNPAYAKEATIITDPVTRKVSEAFDAAYATMLTLLVRFLAHTDETPAEIATLQSAAFFPMMTTIIRPLAEALTLLPAHPGGTATAGPSFDIARRVEFLPHRAAAWRVLASDLAGLAERAAELAAETSLAPAMRQRFQLIFENATRIAANFTGGMNLPPSSP